MIKFWSYNREYEKYKHSLLKKINSVLSRGNIFFGEELKNFEKKFVKKYNAKYGIAVGSGTDALLISLKAINLRPGDEVITVPNTAIPTISAIINAGGKPRFVDIDENYLIDVKKIEKKINSKTKAIIPVHLYGNPCNMDQLIKISKKYKIHIIEDCAQSQGAKYKNKYIGTFGKFGCFSFYPTKVLGGYGDGGFILTNNYDAYKKIKRIRFYGIETVNKKNKFLNKYYSNENGINSRLDEIQSCILNYKFKNVDKFIRRRINIAKMYFNELKSTNLKLPKKNLQSKHVYHLFTVYHTKAKKIIKLLDNKNIETRVIYPYPIHLMKAYSKFNPKKKDLINCEKKSKGIFSLPLYPEIKNKEIKFICKNIKNILKKNNW